MKVPLLLVGELAHMNSVNVFEDVVFDINLPLEMSQLSTALLTLPHYFIIGMDNNGVREGKNDFCERRRSEREQKSCLWP